METKELTVTESSVGVLFRLLGEVDAVQTTTLVQMIESILYILFIC